MIQPLSSPITGSPHSDVRLAVLGCGRWGKNLVRVFAQLGALAAVHDIDGEVAAATAERYGVPSRGLRDILDSEALDAVVVAAPAAQHALLVQAALTAGKHVFVEKPLALDLGDASQLCRLAKGLDRVLMVGHLLQYHPAFRRLEALVESGGLGRVLYLYSNRLNFGRFRREENILWSFAPHDISMMLRLANGDPDQVIAVRAVCLHDVIADVTTTHLRWPSGIRGHVFVSWLHPFKEQKLVVVGDSGMAVFDDGEPWERKIAVYRHRIEWRAGNPEPSPADATHLEVEPAEPLEVECRHFLDCVVAGARPRTDGEEGLRVLRILDAAERSMSGSEPAFPDRRHPVAGAAVAERFPGARIHETAWIDDSVEIGPGTTIWHFSHLLAGSRLGRDCNLGQNVVVGPDVTIGDRCSIQNNVSVYKGVTLEDGVFCGPSCVFTNVRTPRADVERKEEYAPTRVSEGASIGANATVVCGVTIGQYALVAAGAVVTRDVGEHEVVAGVPARRIGWVSHDGEVLGEDLVCPRSGRRYELVNGSLQERP